MSIYPETPFVTIPRAVPVREASLATAAAFAGEQIAAAVRTGAGPEAIKAADDAMTEFVKPLREAGWRLVVSRSGEYRVEVQP